MTNNLDGDHICKYCGKIVTIRIVTSASRILVCHEQPICEEFNNDLDATEKEFGVERKNVETLEYEKIDEYANKLRN